MKQSKLRQRRVWRYAVLYFVLLIVFVALVVGPVVAGSMIRNSTKSLTSDSKSTMYLFQPVGLNHNDTRNRTETGTGAVSGAAASSTSSVAARMALLF